MTQTQNTRWPEGAIVYQIYPRSFFDSNNDGVGDIKGIEQKLPYIKSLGANAIWLSPFYPSPMADFGYDVADYCDVDPIFGSLKDLEELISAAHAMSIKLIVDLVPNHTSDEHTWFRQSRQSTDGPFHDWYIWRDAKGHDKKGVPLPPNNWVEVLTGGSAWEWEPARQQFYLHSFDVRQPDLNWSNPLVREAIHDVMRFWLDKGVDGFRVDAVQFMAKDPQLVDEPKNPHYVAGRDTKYGSLVHTKNHGWPPLYAYLAGMAAVLKEERYKKRQLFMVTEAYPDTQSPVDEYLAFYEGMDPEVAAPFIFEGLNLPWHAKDWREFLSTFHDTLANFSKDCVASYAFGNHDQHRIVSRLGEPAARAAAVLLLSLPGMAFIYNGEELGMKNGEIPADAVQDPGALGGSGRDPERTPLQWSSAKNAGFTLAEHSWLPVTDNYQTHNIEVETQDADSFLSLYRLLGGLRNNSDALKKGEILLSSDSDQSVLCYRRRNEKESYTVLINFTDKACSYTSESTLGRVEVSSHPQKGLHGSHDLTVSLHPYEAVIFKSL